MTDKAMYQAWQAWHADLDPEDTPQVNPQLSARRSRPLAERPR